MGAFQQNLRSQNSFKEQGQNIKQKQRSFVRLKNEHDGERGIQAFKISINYRKDWQLASQMFTLRKKSLYLVKVIHFTFLAEQSQFYNSKTEGFVYLQRIVVRLTQLDFFDLQNQIHLMAQCIFGFEKLYQYFGPFEVHPDCIGVNKQKVVKVWHNPNFSLLYPKKNLASQSEMVMSIIQTICSHNMYENRSNDESLKAYFLKKIGSFSFEELKRTFYEYLSKFCHKIPANLTGWIERTDPKNQSHKKQYEGSFIENSSLNKNHIWKRSEIIDFQRRRFENGSNAKMNDNQSFVDSKEIRQIEPNNALSQIKKSKNSGLTNLYQFNKRFPSHRLPNKMMESGEYKPRVLQPNNRVIFSFLKPHNTNKDNFEFTKKQTGQIEYQYQDRQFEDLTPFSIKRNSFFIRNEFSNIFDHVRDTQSIVNRSLTMNHFDQQNQLQSYSQKDTQFQNSHIEFLRLGQADELVEGLSKQLCQPYSSEVQNSIGYHDFLQKWKIRQTKLNEFDEEGQSENEEENLSEINFEYSSQNKSKDEFKSLGNLQYINKLAGEWSPCGKDNTSSKLINMELSSNQKSISSHQNVGSKLYSQFPNQKSVLFFQHSLLNNPNQFESS